MKKTQMDPAAEQLQADGTSAQPILSEGLRWLFDTEQPEGAVLSHHGITLAAGSRLYFFVPAGTDGLPVVVVNVAEPEWKDEGPDRIAVNPLGPCELLNLTAELAVLGAEVAETWNGHPLITGSLALKRPAHPSLIAAVDRYRAGCPTHPERSVFCECGWYDQGRSQVIAPALAGGAAEMSAEVEADARPTPLETWWASEVFDPEPGEEEDTVVACRTADGHPVALQLDSDDREALGDILLNPDPDDDGDDEELLELQEPLVADTEQLADIRARALQAVADPWLLSDCETKLRVWRQSALQHVVRNDDGEIAGWSEPPSYRTPDLIVDIDLETWDPGEDDQDDQRRADIGAMVTARQDDVPYLLGLVDQLRAALSFAHEFRVPIRPRTGGYGELVVQRDTVVSDRWAITDGSRTTLRAWTDERGWQPIGDIGLQGAYRFGLAEALEAAEQVAAAECVRREAEATGGHGA